VSARATTASLHLATAPTEVMNTIPEITSLKRYDMGPR
jgi:hypothetical protein